MKAHAHKNHTDSKTLDSNIISYSDWTNAVLLVKHTNIQTTMLHMLGSYTAQGTYGDDVNMCTHGVSTVWRGYAYKGKV